MKIIKWKPSLHRRITWMMMVSLFLVCSVIIGYNLYIFRIAEVQVEQTIANSLDLYAGEVEFAMENTETFLVNKCLAYDRIQKIKNPKQKMDRYLAIHEMQDLFQTSLSSYSLMDGLFLYDKQNGLYIGEAKRYDRTDERQLIKNSVDELIRGFWRSAEEQENEWFSVLLGEDYFLIKMFQIQETYIGCWIHVDTFLEKLENIPASKKDYVLVLDSEYKVLKDNFSPKVLDTEKDSIILDGMEYKIIRQQTKRDAFSFLVLCSQESFAGSKSEIGRQAAIAGIMIICLCMGMTVVQKQLFDRPMNRLAEAMNQLKRGNFNIRVGAENVFTEFSAVNDAFDSMIQEIRKLKIDIYEERIQKQRAELMYLQEQINPHFLTNCMNLIRNLSIMGEEEKVQQAAILLSSYIRYALTGSTQVLLEKEIAHVKNFEKLQKMRYGDQFMLSVDIEAELVSCRVPAMIVQVFVENAIKHQLDPDVYLEIFVRIKKEGPGCLHIQIWDSGEGFSKEVLGQISAGKPLKNSEGEHIGIYNVCQRLLILYEGKAEIRFSNKKSGGACIDIWIPMLDSLEKG